MTEICGAIEENYLDRFKLFTNYSNGKVTLAGQIKRVYGKKIFVEMDDIYFETPISKAVLSKSKKFLFDVSFELNDLPFQVQRIARDFIESHGLFSELINNSEYDTTKAENSSTSNIGDAITKT